MVEDMHIRKKTMLDLADMAIALPGSNGTFEEVLEAITWRQLGLFSGKVVIYNSYGYYDNMIQMFRKATEDGFMNVGVDFFTASSIVPFHKQFRIDIYLKLIIFIMYRIYN